MRLLFLTLQFVNGLSASRSCDRQAANLSSPQGGDGSEGQQRQAAGLGCARRNRHAGLRLIAPGEGVEGEAGADDTDPAVLEAVAEVETRAQIRWLAFR